MKKIACLTVLLLAAGFATAQSAAVSPRLALWITDPIGATNAAQCHQMALRQPPATSPTATERDVTGWDRRDATWTLDPARHAGAEVAESMTDHCFVLSLDGKLISGVVLSRHSARLVRFPTLAVSSRDGVLSLRLLSGFAGEATPPLDSERLDRILHDKANRE